MSEERRDVLVGGIEAGGTKFVCAVGRGPEDVRRPENRMSFNTGQDPAKLLSSVVEWFESREKAVGKLAAIGVASFGPVDLDESSRTYGYITSTPKVGWNNTHVLGPIRDRFPGLPIGFDTDVNGAALGEHVWGAAAGLGDFVYITIGTGIGAGGMTRGQLLHGLVHAPATRPRSVGAAHEVRRRRASEPRVYALAEAHHHRRQRPQGRPFRRGQVL
jgi:fructokinase